MVCCCGQSFASSMIHLANNFGLGLDRSMGTYSWYLCVLLELSLLLEVQKWLNGPIASWLSPCWLSVSSSLNLLCRRSYNGYYEYPASHSRRFDAIRTLHALEKECCICLSWSTQALVLPRLQKSERSGYWATALSYELWLHSLLRQVESWL